MCLLEMGQRSRRVHHSAVRPRRFVQLAQKTVCGKLPIQSINEWSLRGGLGGVNMKRNTRYGWPHVIAGLVAVACPMSSALALTVNSPGQVLMVDGTDSNVTVNISAIDVTAPVSRYDFGFVTGSAYTRITGTTGSYTFMGGDIVNFALRDRGTDNTFGTSDDLVYSIADPLDYANQTYAVQIPASSSQNPVVSAPYYRSLVITWDLDRNGNADTGFDLAVTTPLRTNDGFAPAAVPLPAAVWLFSAGLMGLGAISRKSRR